MREVELLMNDVPVMNTPRPFEDGSVEKARWLELRPVYPSKPVNCTEHGWGCNCWLCRQARNPNAEFI